MKAQSCVKLFTALILLVTTATINSSSSYAQSSDPGSNNSSIKRVKFICGQSNNAPATIAQTQRGDVTVIRWVSGFFSDSGFTPEKRCQEVSSRFQTYYSNGTLRFLASGRINNQPVICTAKKQGARCTDVLLTLEPNDDPNQVLKQLLNIRSGASNAPLSRGVGNEKPLYVNLDAYLKTAPVESINSEFQSPAVPTSPSQPNSSNTTF